MSHTLCTKVTISHHKPIASSALNFVIYIMVPKLCLPKTHYLFPKFRFIRNMKNKY